jgi:hypothetical protein
MSHPFHEGVLGFCGRRQVSWLPGRPLAPSRDRVVRSSGCASYAHASGFPGHSGGSAPDFHRLPLATDPYVDQRGSLPSDGVYPPAKVTVNLTRIYTRLGDGGETHLGDMSRVSKNDPRIEAYGTIDELNALIGLALATGDPDEPTAKRLKHIQNDLVRPRRRPVGPADRRARAPARRARADSVARGGVRRGQCDAAAAAQLRPARRHAACRIAACVPNRVAGPSAAR